MQITDVLIKPVLTEKSYGIMMSEPKKYTFLVNPKANKNYIKQAFKAIYGVTPTAVNTKIKKPARIRTGSQNPGYSRLEKIAIITVPYGVEVAITGEKPENNESTNSK
ncbi:50S ribosomal protein L23 [Mycoplasma bradburyae]|uniref:Large ribosomal subunit protein uL23 n=1 Tax=Mycoplasma bradburyae TaxID=2963128 RepID=A0AAW6HRL3_9MOLU|nr:50S ribosomal protein L23 [Mycoplasma bradburyae]MDC4163267.1 50S ribosomal protein L23 [Mycoplasma bradburyae]MDC4181881.1 50S ribosomal protein L23 [Mycoplasma bradburyae]MDC4182580.1 50S ribosomal protein L23 [Mycoplasma bradburyae]MDC4183258.1 50S ribosomal protein L23 [Mycoplasma bradburyae]MDC4184064.1 50S ribosomal protein L23 [Mycoplasma bradburyae]